MLVHKGGVINFKKTHRIRMIKPISLVKNQDPQLPSIGFDAARNKSSRSPAGASSGEALTQSLISSCISQVSPRPYLGGHLAVVPRQPKVEPNLLFIASDLLKGRPDNCDQRASQSTATIELEYKT